MKTNRSFLFRLLTTPSTEPLELLQKPSIMEHCYLLEKDIDRIELDPGGGHQGRWPVLTAAVVDVTALVTGPGHFQAECYVAQTVGRLELQRR